LKVTLVRATILFLFSPKRFLSLSAEWDEWMNVEADKVDLSQQGRLDTRKSRALQVRRSLTASFIIVSITVIAAWVTGHVAYLAFGPSGSIWNQVLQFGGVGILLWATLGKQGWSIQTFGGSTLLEKIDMAIYRSLYVIGSFMLALSVSWPVR
jgi:hypothetical protein